MSSAPSSRRREISPELPLSGGTWATWNNECEGLGPGLLNTARLLEVVAIVLFIKDMRDNTSGTSAIIHLKYSVGKNKSVPALIRAPVTERLYLIDVMPLGIEVGPRSPSPDHSLSLAIRSPATSLPNSLLDNAHLLETPRFRFL